MDPTILGIPNDQLAHAANVHRAARLVGPYRRCLSPRDAAALEAAIAEALTERETRGFAAGMASVTPSSPKRSCRWCAHDGGGTCNPSNVAGSPAAVWIGEIDAAGRLESTGYPDDDADNCPGWAAKETS